MAKASDNQFPSVLLGEGTVPTSPGAGTQRIYVDTADHKLKRVNSSGTVTVIEGGSLTGVTEVTTPSSPSAGTQTLFLDSADHKLKRVNSSGTVTTIEGGGTATFTGVKVYLSAAQSIPNNANTGLAWDAEDWDTDGFHDNVTNNSRLTVPSGLGGKYRVSVSLAANAVVNTPFFLVGLRKNSSGASGDTERGGRDNCPTTGGNEIPIVNASTVLSLAAGDYIEALGYQNSGGSIALNTTYCAFEMQKVG